MEEDRELHVVKVSARTNPKAAAGSIATVLRECGFAEVKAIGAASVNQAVKAIIITRGYCAPIGLDIVCTPSFETTAIEGNEKTRIVFKIEER